MTILLLFAAQAQAPQDAYQEIRVANRDVEDAAVAVRRAMQSLGIAIVDEKKPDRTTVEFSAKKDSIPVHVTVRRSPPDRLHPGMLFREFAVASIRVSGPGAWQNEQLAGQLRREYEAALSALKP